MEKQLLTLIILIALSIYSSGQSYIGLSGGYTDPLAYVSLPSNSGHMYVDNIETKKRKLH